MTEPRPAFLPPAVVLVEARHDVALATAWPEELAAVVDFSPARQAEYVTVRHCARRGLSDLGLPVGPILDDAAGAPIWPVGVIGSLTHCRGYRAAALTRRGDLTALGIDAEPAAALPAGVLKRITVPDEAEAVSELTSQDASQPWDRLLFCAKEALYKAWYPLTRVGLGFHDVTIELRPDGRGDLAFRRPVPEPVAGLDWHLTWVVADGIARAAVWA